MENLIYLIIVCIMIFIIWTRYLIYDNNINIKKNKEKINQSNKNKDKNKEIIEPKTNNIYTEEKTINPIDQFYLSIYQFKLLSPMNFQKSYQATTELIKLCDEVINSNDNSCGISIDQINQLKHNAIQYLDAMERSTDSCLLQNKLENAIAMLNKILNKKITLATNKCQTTINTSENNIYVRHINVGPYPVNKYTNKSELFKKF